MENFLPIILGSDLNTYTIAREFHEAYRRKAVVATSAVFLPCIHSKIIEIYKKENFSKDSAVFVEVMNQIYEDYKNDIDKFVIFAPDDVMRTFALENADKLAFKPIFPYADAEVLGKLKTKRDFYEAIAELDLAPQTLIATKENYKELSYPANVFIKADNDVAYKRLNFEGWQKGYHAKTVEETLKILELVYANGYEDNMIVQEFIKGGDGSEYSVDGYRSKNGIAMSICQNVMLDKRPEWIGNFVVKIDTDEGLIYEFTEKILESLGVYGLFNIDYKKDAETGKFYAFEINPRQGRGHYYAAQNGINTTQIAIEDLCNDNFSPKRGDIPFAYYNLKLDKTLAHMPADLKEEFLSTQRKTNTKNPLVYKEDWGLRRKLKIEKYLDKLSDETFIYEEL